MPYWSISALAVSALSLSIAATVLRFTWQDRQRSRGKR